jgi:hypothetical protein
VLEVEAAVLGPGTRPLDACNQLTLEAASLLVRKICVARRTVYAGMGLKGDESGRASEIGGERTEGGGWRRRKRGTVKKNQWWCRNV